MRAGQARNRDRTGPKEKKALGTCKTYEWKLTGGKEGKLTFHHHRRGWKSWAHPLAVDSCGLRLCPSKGKGNQHGSDAGRKSLLKSFPGCLERRSSHDRAAEAKKCRSPRSGHPWDASTIGESGIGRGSPRGGGGRKRIKRTSIGTQILQGKINVGGKDISKGTSGKVETRWIDCW